MAARHLRLKQGVWFGLFASWLAGVRGDCVPVEIFGPNNETRYQSADVSANRDWLLSQADCIQVCLITAPCEGYVFQTRPDGSSHCYLKTNELGTVRKDFLAVGGENSSIWSIAACKSADTYAACLGDPIMAADVVDNITLNVFVPSQPSPTPFEATLDQCTASCLGDSACTGFSIASQAPAGSGFQCTLLHSVIDPAATRQWRSDYATAVYNITACRAVSGGKSSSGLGAGVIAALSISAVALACCTLVAVALLVAWRRGRWKAAHADPTGAKGAADASTAECADSNKLLGDPAYSVFLNKGSDGARLPPSLDGSQDCEDASKLAPLSLVSGGATSFSLVTVTQRQCGDSKHEARSLLLQQLRYMYRSNGTLLGKFKLQGVDNIHQRIGGQGVVQFAHTVFNPDRLYAVKFFLDELSFATEQRHMLNCALHHVLPPVHALESNAEGSIQVLGRALPPFVIIEKGESLEEWARRKNANADLNFSNSVNIVLHLSQRVGELHKAGLAHRDLKPGNVILLPSRNEWTVIDFGSAAEIGSEAPMSISPAYAAPETVVAWLEKRYKVVADAAVDVWALGVIAFELLTMTPNYSAADRDLVARTMAGEVPLPWEDRERPDYSATMHSLGFMKNTLLRMLSRDPARRPSLQEVQDEWNAVLRAGSAPSVPLE